MPRNAKDIAVKLFQAGQPQTARELGITPVLAGRLVQAEVFTVRGQRRTGGRGRPAFEYGLTKRARDRARRASR